MSSSPTPSTPIRFGRTERALTALLIAIGVGWGGTAIAHEPGAGALPESTGWRTGAALAAVAPTADARWPTAAWPGVLINGSSPRDEHQGLTLEHGTLDLAARFNRAFGVHLAVGWHDREKAHTEAATAQARFSQGGHELEARLGRDTVRMGAVIDGAGHFDRFSQPPLVKRAVLNDQWIDDGLALAWRRAHANGLRALELGVWRGKAFPGGPSGPAVPSLHLHAGWGHLDAHLAAAHFEPKARGAAALSAGSVGHVHGSLDCRVSLQQRVCFDGTADVLGASVLWEPARGDWTLALAGLLRQERGAFYSASGQAHLSARIAGAWADVVWRPTPRWSLAIRSERLIPDNRLEGFGTVLLSDAAGLTGGGAVSRLSTALLFAPHPQITLSVEGAQERFASGKVNQLALRAIWRSPKLLGGSW